MLEYSFKHMWPSICCGHCKNLADGGCCTKCTLKQRMGYQQGKVNAVGGVE